MPDGIMKKRKNILRTMPKIFSELIAAIFVLFIIVIIVQPSEVERENAV